METLRIESNVIGSRFQCPQCESSFARKEHLTRHVKTHNEEHSLECSICGKRFNRSDSLLRHFNKHGQGPKPSSRTKRACFVCHAAKIKCDGEDPCRSCIKKAVECRYVTSRESPLKESDGSLDSSPSIVDQEPSPPEFGISSIHSLLSTIQIRKDEETKTLSPSVIVNRNSEYVEAYFTHFHHRFPILHRVSHDDPAKKGSMHYLLLSSIEMLGAWLVGSEESKEFALLRYQILNAECLVELSKVSSSDKFQQSLPSGLCQAACLNVVFVLYCGNEHAISRGVILHNMLIAALRETGFFDQTYIWPDQRPGYFIPMGLMKAGERERLSQHLYRIDTYLSSLRGTSRILSTEELIFKMPSSFSLWNIQGLLDWEDKLRTQSLQRSQQPLSEEVKRLGNPSQCPGSDLLVEDVHIALCYVHTRLLLVHSQVRTHDIDDIVISEISSCRTQLECLKARLDQITYGELCAEALRSCYHGFEQQSNGWQDIVEARVQTLWFDATILYHYLKLQLYVDPTRITQVVNEFALDFDTFTPEQQQIIGKRRCSTATWVVSPIARQALCCAADILAALQGLEARPLIDPKTLDPIAYIAVSTAALIVWTHIHLGMYACSDCGPEMGFETNPHDEVNLSPTTDINNRKEEWVSRMLVCRVLIDGVELCACNIVKVLDKFHAFIPKGWGLSEVIAPGVFSAGLLSVLAGRTKGHGHQH